MKYDFLRHDDPFGRLTLDDVPQRTVETTPLERTEELLTDGVEEWYETPRWQRLLVRFVALLLGLILMVYLLSGWHPLWSLLILCGLMALAALSGSRKNSEE